MVPVIQTQGFKQVKQNLQSYLDSSGLVLQQKYAPIPTHENLYSGKEGPIVHMALANAQREAGQKQMLLIFVHFGLIIPHVVLSFKFFQIWVLGYILNNLNRNRRFQVWPFRLMGDLHYKLLPKLFLNTLCCHVSKSCYLGSSQSPGKLCFS